MPRIAGRPNLARERFTVYYDSADLERADAIADELNTTAVPAGKAPVYRSDVLRAAVELALGDEAHRESVQLAVAATHPSLRPREAATP